MTTANFEYVTEPMLQTLRIQQTYENMSFLPKNIWSESHKIDAKGHLSVTQSAVKQCLWRKIQQLRLM